MFGNADSVAAKSKHYPFLKELFDATHDFGIRHDTRGIFVRQRQHRIGS